jgi:hypothetical protein
MPIHTIAIDMTNAIDTIFRWVSPSALIRVWFMANSSLNKISTVGLDEFDIDQSADPDINVIGAPGPVISPR